MDYTPDLKPSINYIKDVFKDDPHYRHYAEDVKFLLKTIAKLKRELRKLK